jgi:hypothetical protein
VERQSLAADIREAIDDAAALAARVGTFRTRILAASRIDGWNAGALDMAAGYATSAAALLRETLPYGERP